MRALKIYLFSADTVIAPMYIEMREEESYNYWCGIVYWSYSQAGGEGSCYTTLSYSGINLAYINEIGNIAINGNTNTVTIRARKLTN